MIIQESMKASPLVAQPARSIRLTLGSRETQLDEQAAGFRGDIPSHFLVIRP